MKKIISLFKTFSADESGAALIEYSLLIGLIVAAVVAVIISVGTWVLLQWTTLGTNLSLTW